MKITDGTNILVVAAHPDDEILGCGGSIHKWTRAGAKIHALILAEGLTSRADRRESIGHDAICVLREDARRSAEIIGYRSITFEDFPDNRMDHVDLLDVAHTVNKRIEQFNPSIILTHHYGDLNIDHRICYQAVLTACRPLPDCEVKTILTFETPSATEWNFPYSKNIFSPNIFVDISANIEAKIEAIECYTTEKRNFPHPRSPKGLAAIAQRWGSVIGVEYAEAFVLIRTLI